MIYPKHSPQMKCSFNADSGTVDTWYIAASAEQHLLYLFTASTSASLKLNETDNLQPITI